MPSEGQQQAEPTNPEKWQKMNSKCQNIELNDGHFIPVLGFGTAVPEEVKAVMLGAEGLEEIEPE